MQFEQSSVRPASATPTELYLAPDRTMDHDSSMPLDLSHAAPDIITMLLRSMPLRDRFNCALVCKAWAEAATAATHSIILRHSRQDFSGLQRWMEKYGDQLEVLQLHDCCKATLSSLPCCAKLRDLLLHAHWLGSADVRMAGRVWGDIASATRLTSISLKVVQTTSQQADVVAALTALPNLEQLTLCNVLCNDQQLSASSLFQHMTQLTSLDLQGVTAAALQHLGSLTKLQHLSISAARNWAGAADSWAAAGYPGLQELKALTSLKLSDWVLIDIPASASQLTALRQLEVHTATPTALNRLHVLTCLTQLSVWHMTGLSPDSSPLQLPGLQLMELCSNVDIFMPMSFLVSCAQLQSLKLQGFQLKSPGSLVASTMLQHLELSICTITAADGAAAPFSWQQIVPAAGRLPYLTSLKLGMRPGLQHAGIDGFVECCSNLQVLHLDTVQDSCAPALARLSGLTNLGLKRASDEQCSAIVQLTGLRQLTVKVAQELSEVGLRQLAALKQLTSLGCGSFSHSHLTIMAIHLMNDRLPGLTEGIINKVCWQICTANM